MYTGGIRLASISKDQVMRKAFGGPVYPQTSDVEIGGEGLSLRDYFAGLALQGILANGRAADAPLTAEVAYDFADAMIAERQQSLAAK
jgi:hypothetical protein